MNVLLDENFPVSAAAAITEAGHTAIAFAEICDFGDDDEAVFAAAQASDAVILTSDRDFYHTMPLRHPQHAGIVVVALHQPNRQAILSRLEWFFTTVHPPYTNKVFIIRDYSFRMKTFTIS